MAGAPDPIDPARRPAYASGAMSDASRFDALCVHAGADIPGLDMATPPISPPIFQSSVFETPDLAVLHRAMNGEPGAYVYSRHANPTVAAFEAAVAALEDAETAVATASGMGAITATLLSRLKAGDGVVTTSALYGNTRQLLDAYLAPLGVAVHHLTAEAIVAEGVPPGTRIVFTEPISNPLLVVADVPRLAEAAHAVGARLVVDNTFATPFHCRPLALGADVVVHSATKYLGGHGDLVAGVAAGAAALVEPIRRAARVLGANGAPFEAWLALRGLRTLHLRMARHADNAARVAAFLADHPKVRAVHYPGLPGHPTHAAARRILERGFGGMVTFELAAGEADGRAAFERFLGGLATIPFAASLADVGTMLSHPATTSHRDLLAAERMALGIGEGLVRLSCGIEAADDIVADLARGLAEV